MLFDGYILSYCVLMLLSLNMMNGIRWIGALRSSMPFNILRVFFMRCHMGLAPGCAAVAGNFSIPETRNCKNFYEIFDSATSYIEWVRRKIRVLPKRDP